MKILQVGLAKSGNFWLYKILQSIAGYGGFEQNSFIQNHPIHSIAKTWDLSYKEQADIDVLDIGPYKCFYRISSIFRMPIEDIDDYLAHCSHVWTHSTWNFNSASILPKFDRIVYIVRDPRDIAFSLSRFVLTPYMKKYYPQGKSDAETYLESQMDNIIKDWVKHVGGYLQQKRSLKIHFVFYERLLHAVDEELSGLLKYLGIELDDIAINHIKREVDFSTMKSQNPQHVNKGRSGSWISVFTDAQKERAIEIAGPMLSFLNYSSNKFLVENNMSLPRLPDHFNNVHIREIIAHANPMPVRQRVISNIKHLYRLFIK